MTLGSNTSGHLFDTTFTTDGVLYSAANGVITSTSAGNSGEVLTSNGTGVAPTFQAGGGGTGPIINQISSTIDFKTVATTTIFTPTVGQRFITLSCTIIYDIAVGANQDSLTTLGNNATSYDNWNNGFTNPDNLTTQYFMAFPLAAPGPVPVFTSTLPPVFNVQSGDTGTTVMGRVILTGYYIT